MASSKPLTQPIIEGCMWERVGHYSPHTYMHNGKLVGMITVSQRVREKTYHCDLIVSVGKLSKSENTDKLGKAKRLVEKWYRESLKKTVVFTMDVQGYSSILYVEKIEDLTRELENIMETMTPDMGETLSIIIEHKSMFQDELDAMGEWEPG